MPQVINTNISSLNAQRNLDRSQNALSVSLQRLSSGLRINSAKDDAAGLAITERFTAQIRGLNQAARNSNDGVSLAQTAEGDLGQISANLQRVRELAVQSANASNSATDRVALQEEAAELVAEVDRIAATSNFNGVNLLDGTFTSQQFQVGANAGDTITVANFTSARTANLGRSFVATDAGNDNLSALTAGDLLVNGVDVGAVADPGAAGSLSQAISTAITTADSQVSVAIGASSLNLGAFTQVDKTSTASNYALVVEGVTVITEAISTANSVTAAEIDTQLALTSTQDSLTAAGVSFTGTAAGSDLTFSKADGSNLDISEVFGAGTTGLAGGFTATVNGLAGASSGATTTTSVEYGALTLTSNSDIVIAGNAPGNAGLGAGTETVSTVGTGTTIASVDISTVQGANDTLAAVDNALNSINQFRANLGAIQNRFESVVQSVQSSAENLSAARSRIQDADFAAETASLTRAQILQQAGISILAQANSQPQSVLALLQ